MMHCIRCDAQRDISDGSCVSCGKEFEEEEMTDLDKCKEMFNKANVKFGLVMGQYFTQLRVVVKPNFEIHYVFNQDGSFKQLGVVND